MSIMQITIPPLPVVPAGIDLTSVYIGSAVAAVLCLALLLWGRTILGRIVLAISTAGAGYLLAGYYSTFIPLPSLATQISSAVILGIFAVVAARIVWALVVSAFFEAAAVAFIINHFMNADPTLAWPAFVQQTDFQAWAGELGRYCLVCLDVARQSNQTAILMITLPACLLPLMVGLIQPRIAAIFVTGLAGGIGLTGSLWFVAVLFRSTLWPADAMRFLIPAGVAIVLAIIGWVYQGNSEAAAIRAAAKAQEEARAKEDQKAKEDRVPGLREDKKK
jgi:hypothetical protein